MDIDALDKLPTDVKELQRLARQLQQQIQTKEREITEQERELTKQERELNKKERKIAKQQNKLASLHRIIEKLFEERRLDRARRFAANSEKGALQYCLFDEAEQLVETEEGKPSEDPDSGIEVKAHKRRGGRKPLPKDLPRTRIVHELSEEEKRCACGCQMQKIDEVSSEQLDIIPAQITVIEHVRYKYACQHCDEAPKTAPMPAQPIPKSRASAGFLAYVATSKYADGIPLYRQCHVLGRLGIEQERHTLAHQMIKAGELTQPLINLLNENALDHPVVQMDETRTQVLQEPGKAASSQSYMWVMRGGPPDQPVVLFNYDPSRSQTVPERLLFGYQGYLQTDGYAGYNKVLETEGITGLGCWQHARRKFTDAQKAIKRSDRMPHTRVQQALRFIGRLYAIEKSAKKKEPEERYRIRQQKSVPVLEEFKKWLDHINTNPSGKLGEAITYLRNQWERLLVYCEDGRLEIDNNWIENKIRPFAIGRKNWLFSASQKGATASASLYSLIETAKANHLNEYAYLKYIFTELPKATCLEDYERLLPWNVELSVLQGMLKASATNAVE
ncbi:MAG: IS66 family transposase [Gammaproteobacteria bacterium]|nr:IS66 family transposase [Gammaproteobacteria bacterium]MDH5799646.1 IS66 family transposase [Gammaproteobacteria bacterium]